ncbi:lipoprotein signal peptidase [Geomicrobium sp. JCM 19037]|uniref:signal peptidase II n=1 Tax=Geomicrobium sp. JCM 19037 TaxID=1460634 RepID=UPI00045F4850|nr:signal peptidase II [Geomicrobium sp. JCM 19037]GAK04634.1 lipoprotein signal peptidase [Geomicrobium sp. JCM 19037]
MAVTCLPPSFHVFFHCKGANKQNDFILFAGTNYYWHRQITKIAVDRNMEIAETIPIIENVLHITSHRNMGAAFGILQGQMWLFYIVTVIVTVGIIYYMPKLAKQNKWYGISLGVLLGGTLGNFIDRLFRNEVVDFVDVYIGSYSFPIFNVADAALTIGVIVLLVLMFVEDRKEKKEKNHESA